MFKKKEAENKNVILYIVLIRRNRHSIRLRNPNKVQCPICWVSRAVATPISLQTYVEKGNTVIPILQMINSDRERQNDSSRIAQGM